MKVLFYFGHPSQYLFLRDAIKILREQKNQCDIVIKSKDVLEQLLVESNETFLNILPEGRKSNKLGIFLGLIKRDIRLSRVLRGKHYDILVGSDPSVAHNGFMFRIPVITVIEDDIDVIRKLAQLTYPFTSIILTPLGCRTGKYEKKTVHYFGYMKLAYLHPLRFKKEAPQLKQPYFLIRLSSLNAYHDEAVRGFSMPVLNRLINILSKKGKVFISSEGALDNELKSYELKISPGKMQQVLANAEMLISDSQSMTMEAAMLGVPSVRFSDFAGKISVLEDLEHNYGLTFGVPTDHPERLFTRVNELLTYHEGKIHFQGLRRKMLSDKIDVTAFLVWFIGNFPGSVKIMRNNPDYQERFKSNQFNKAY